MVQEAATCKALRLVTSCDRLASQSSQEPQSHKIFALPSRTKEKFRAEDEANKLKIEAKNGLENYCFTMRNTLNEEKLKDKFEGGDKEKIESAVQETLDWLDKNQLAEKDEFEAKQKELEGIVNPIMMKVYQAAGGGGMPEGGMPGGGMGGAPGGASGPTVEEVD